MTTTLTDMFSKVSCVRAARAAIIGLAIALLAGCSAWRIGYDQGPLLARWWLDRYVDFQGEQLLPVREGLAQWFAWHRTSQLPEYAQLLARLGEEAGSSATPEQMCRWGEELRRRAALAAESLLPHAARVVPLLEPAQIDRLQGRLDESNQEFRRKVAHEDRAHRQRESVKRTTERIEDFYGRLDEAQRRLVAASLAASPFDADAWYAQRLAQQRDLVRTLRELQAERADRTRALGALQALHARLSAPPPSDPASYGQRLLRHNCEFAARLHNSTTAAQRQHLREKLQGWERDARALAGAATRTAQN